MSHAAATGTGVAGTTPLHRLRPRSRGPRVLAPLRTCLVVRLGEAVLLPFGTAQVATRQQAGDGLPHVRVDVQHHDLVTDVGRQLVDVVGVRRDGLVGVPSLVGVGPSGVSTSITEPSARQHGDFYHSRDVGGHGAVDRVGSGHRAPRPMC